METGNGRERAGGLGDGFGVKTPKYKKEGRGQTAETQRARRWCREEKTRTHEHGAWGTRHMLGDGGRKGKVESEEHSQEWLCHMRRSEVRSIHPARGCQRRQMREGKDVLVIARCLIR